MPDTAETIQTEYNKIRKRETKSQEHATQEGIQGLHKPEEILNML